jgi:hypothetical protein
MSKTFKTNLCRCFQYFMILAKAILIPILKKFAIQLDFIFFRAIYYQLYSETAKVIQIIQPERVRATHTRLY